MSDAPSRPDHWVVPRGPRCPRCLGPTWYSWPEGGHDAFFCVVCDEWAEPACDVPGCPSCAHRPARPLELVAELDFMEHLLPQ